MSALTVTVRYPSGSTLTFGIEVEPGRSVVDEIIENGHLEFEWELVDVRVPS